MARPRLIARPSIIHLGLLIGLTFLGCLAAVMGAKVQTASASTGPITRRVNMPYLGNGPPAESFEPSISWFGQVDRTSNYADVRMWYYDTYMKVTVHVIDRLLWNDPNASPETLDEYDAVAIYLNLDGNNGQVPTSNSYRLVTQLLWGVTPEYQASYRGNGSTWVAAPVSFAGETFWRGSGTNNTLDDKGWSLAATIPFESLGLSGPPPMGTIWGMAFSLHDRDDASGTFIPDQVWPEQMDPNRPATWGQLHFGRYQYDTPVTALNGVTTIRQGLNGASVVDGHVGGHTTCGDGIGHWAEWGEANYAGYSQINIQNQWDISDYPCFSKYFVTFPLDDLPPGKVIIAATLKMRHFGGSANPDGPTPDSYLQLLTVGEDWDESTLTWNSAPLAVENVSGTWVKPTWLSTDLNYEWNVTGALADAYHNGQPLRLALYSADGERHTGKYFWSSDSGVQSISQRPTLEVLWGVPCDSPGVECDYTYLPAIEN